MKVKSLQILFFVFFAYFLHAQVIVSNPITGTNPNTSNPYAIGQTTDPDITSTGIGRGSGISGANANNRYNASGWATAFDSDDYFEIVITPNSSVVMNFTSIDLTLQNSGTGPTSVEIRSSADGFNAILGNPSTGASPGVNNTIDISSLTNITTAITFRIYGYGATAGTGTLSVNDFSINGTAVAPSMPITLISFYAKNDENKNHLTWATASEINNSHFIIEYSVDGEEFKEVGRIRGKGNSNKLVNYSYIHHINVKGTHYYRLTQYDFDGKSEVFNTISVSNKNISNKVRVYPTSTQNSVQVSGIEESEFVQIFDLSGICIKHTYISNNTIDLTEMNNGMYIISVGSSTHRIVKY
jgi:hypothetical protein